MISTDVWLLSFQIIWNRITLHHSSSDYQAIGRKGIKPSIKFLPFLTTLFLICLFNPIYSQHQHKLDSLEELVRNKSGIDKYDPLTDLAIEYGSNEDYDKAIRFLKEAHTIAYRYGDTLKIIQSGRLIGQVFNRLYKLIEAREILLKVLPIAKRTPNSEKEIAKISNNLALIYTYQAAYDKALYYNFQTLERWEMLGDKFYMSISLNNIGLVYYKLSNDDKAIVYYNKALELKKELKDEYDLDRLLINLSLSYINKKDYNKAKECLNRASLVCKEDCSPQIMIESLYANGTIAFRRGDFNLAEAYFVKSYLKAIEINDKRFQLENLLSLSRIYNKQKKFFLAKSSLNKAILIGSALDYNSIMKDVYLEYSFIYNEMRDYNNTARYQGKYIILRDSIYSEELTQNLMVVQAEYEQRENKAMIESQNKVLGLKERIISRQNILEIVAVVAILLLVSLIIVLYRNNRQKKIINKILEQKVRERTQELETSYALIQKTYLDQNNFKEKAAKDIISSISTIKEFCALGMKELSEGNAQQYLHELNNTTDHVALMASSLTENTKA